MCNNLLVAIILHTVVVFYVNIVNGHFNPNSKTTVCVQIKPNGFDNHNPYLMCKPPDIPHHQMQTDFVNPMNFLNQQQGVKIEEFARLNGKNNQHNFQSLFIHFPQSEQNIYGGLKIPTVHRNPKINLNQYPNVYQNQAVHPEVYQNPQICLNHPANQNPPISIPPEVYLNHAVQQNPAIPIHPEVYLNHAVQQNPPISIHPEVYLNHAVHQNLNVHQNLDVHQNSKVNLIPEIHQNPVVHWNRAVQQNSEIYRNQGINQNLGINQNSKVQQFPEVNRNSDVQQKIHLNPESQQNPEVHRNLELHQNPELHLHPTVNQNSKVQHNPKVNQNPEINLIHEVQQNPNAQQNREFHHNSEINLNPILQQIPAVEQNVPQAADDYRTFRYNPAPSMAVVSDYLFGNPRNFNENLQEPHLDFKKINKNQEIAPETSAKHHIDPLQYRNLLEDEILGTPNLGFSPDEMLPIQNIYLNQRNPLQMPVEYFNDPILRIFNNINPHQQTTALMQNPYRPVATVPQNPFLPLKVADTPTFLPGSSSHPLDCANKYYNHPYAVQPIVIAVPWVDYPYRDLLLKKQACGQNYQNVVNNADNHHYLLQSSNLKNLSSYRSQTDGSDKNILETNILNKTATEVLKVKTTDAQKLENATIVLESSEEELFPKDIATQADKAVNKNEDNHSSNDAKNIKVEESTTLQTITNETFLKMLNAAKMYALQNRNSSSVAARHESVNKRQIPYNDSAVYGTTLKKQYLTKLEDNFDKS